MGKVVITGIGIVSALGTSRQGFWEAWLGGASTFRQVTRFESAPLARLYAAEVVDFTPPFPFKVKQPWTGVRSIQFAMAAAAEALADAGLELNDANCSCIGVVFGSSLSCLDLEMKVDQGSVQHGPRTVDPMMFPDGSPGSPSCRVSLQLGLRALNATLANGPTSGLDAISYAAGAIREGLAPVVLAGGLEELTRTTFLFHESMERLAEEPVSCPPFSGKGVVLGEGCAVLVLEDEEHARDRRAPVLAEVGGYGTCLWPEDIRSDRAWHAPAAAIRYALAGADITPDEIDCVFASANGDPDGDRREARALHEVGSEAPVIPVKAALGETHSASGALQAAVCVLAMREQTIPGLQETASPRPVRVGLINSFSTSTSTQNCSSLVLKTCLTEETNGIGYV
jgi:3-oxoacyl-[acyl-carrier-protein] synthase II